MRERVMVGWRAGDIEPVFVYGKGMSIQNMTDARGQCDSIATIIVDRNSGEDPVPERSGFWVLTFTPVWVAAFDHCLTKDREWRRPTAAELEAVAAGAWETLESLWKEIAPASSALVVVDEARSVRLESGWRASPRAILEAISPALLPKPWPSALPPPVTRLGRRWVAIVLSDGDRARAANHLAQERLEGGHLEPARLPEGPTWFQILDAGEDE